MNIYKINKKTWRLLVSFLFLTILVYFFQSSYYYNTFSNSRSDSKDLVTEDHIADVQLNSAATVEVSIGSTGLKPKAFITFLCDDIMGEATEVLVYSLKKTQTKHDIVVLVLDDVTQSVRDKLKHLGAKIINVDQIKYPWNSSSARRKGFNKACRYSKLNLWSLTQYEKVVFLDADTMVVRPIDELFDYPQFSAVVDIGGVLNTGVFVAEPNIDTYNDIMLTYEKAPSYNHGDQGFLNYYFNQTVNFLPGNYNLMIKFTHFSTLASGFVTKNTVKVLHFTSETKPWNFYFLHQREWRENYDGPLFGLWTRALRAMRSQLEQGGLWSNEYEIEGSAVQVSEWENKGRVANICDQTLKSNYGRRYRKDKQFSVIINLSTSSVDLKYFENLLRMYASSKKVSRIYINGNLIKDKGNNDERLVLNASYIKSLSLRKPVRVIPHGPFKTVNNKFNPIQGLDTTAVFLADENVLTSLEDLEFGYEMWRKNQDSIVGYKPASHSFTESTQKNNFIENLDGNARYSMIESKAMFMKSDFLLGYTCLLPEQIHHYIDSHPECHNIAINMLVSGQTGAAPVLVNAKFLFDFKDSSTKALKEKSTCIDDLSNMFNRKNPLVFNREVVSRVSSNEIHEPSSWDNWISSVKQIEAYQSTI